jgi:hypothetical protein
MYPEPVANHNVAKKQGKLKMVGVVVKTIQEHAIQPTICRVGTQFYTRLWRS